MGVITILFFFFFFTLTSFTFVHAEYLFYFQYLFSQDFEYALANSTENGVINYCPNYNGNSGSFLPINFNGVYDYQQTFYTIFYGSSPQQLFSYNIISGKEKQCLTLQGDFNLTLLNMICLSVRTGVLYTFVQTSPIEYNIKGWRGFVGAVDTGTGFITRASSDYIFSDSAALSPDQCVVDDVNSRIIWRSPSRLFITDIRATKDGATTELGDTTNYWLYYSPADGKLYGSVVTSGMAGTFSVSIVSLTISNNSSVKAHTIGVAENFSTNNSPSGTLNLDKNVVSFMRTDKQGFGRGNITQISIVDGKVNIFPTKWEDGYLHSGQVMPTSFVWVKQ